MSRLALGTRVTYTKRASSDSKRGGLRDLTSGDSRRVKHTLPSPEVGQRVVQVWDEQGEGVIVGLTYRQFGRIEAAYYDDSGHLAVKGTVPLYEVKSQLRGRAALVPVDAVTPSEATP